MINPRPRVLDTNVVIVADGLSEQADPACVEAAIESLQEVKRGARVALDDDDLMLEEYLRYFRNHARKGPEVDSSSGSSRASGARPVASG